MKNKILNVLSILFAVFIMINYGIYITISLCGGAKTWNVAVAFAIFFTALTPLLALIFFAPTVRKKHKKAVDVLQTVYICGMGVYVLSFTVFSIWLTAGIPYSVDEHYDNVIVFGGGIYNGNINHDARSRLDTAGQYLKNNPDSICIVSGGVPSGMTVSEAVVMKNALVSSGADPSNIIIEGKAKNTWENLENSLSLTDSDSILCISSDYHVKRIRLMAKDQGYDVDVLASRPEYSFKKHSSYVREYMAYIKYFLGMNDI